MAKVKKFQNHVKGLEYKRLSSKYSTGYNRQRVNQITGELENIHLYFFYCETLSDSLFN